MTIYEKKSCPTCGTVLSSGVAYLNPGVTEKVSCPNCKSIVVTRDDPSFWEADWFEKIMILLGTVKTLVLISFTLYFLWFIIFGS